MALIVNSEKEFLKNLHTNSFSLETNDGISRSWDVTKLWDLTKNQKPKEKSLKEFYDIIKMWMEYGGKKNDRGEIIVPFDISHFERIRNASLTYPILQITDKQFNTRVRVADGMHRLMKCYLSNVELIRVVEISKMPEPDVIYRKK